MVGLNNHRLDEWPEGSNGFLPLKNNRLALLVIKLGSETEVITTPDSRSVRDMCKSYGFNVRRTLDLIDGLSSDTHTLVVDAVQYRKYLVDLDLNCVGEE